MCAVQKIDFHAEHKKWDSTLSFFQDELKSYNNRLQEIVEKNTSTDIRKQVEHFQNQFIVQGGNISKLKNHIQKHEMALARNKGQGSISEQDEKHHSIMEEKMNTQSDVMENLKEEFYRFMSKVM